jgi:hypothetical protein
MFKDKKCKCCFGKKFHDEIWGCPAMDTSILNMLAKSRVKIKYKKYTSFDKIIRKAKKIDNRYKNSEYINPLAGAFIIDDILNL